MNTSLRAASGHSASWCAENIGKVSKRTWSYWENGRNGSFPRVPDDVMEKMLALASAVQNALHQTKGKKMNGYTRRNAEQGIIMNNCGLLQERVFWTEKMTMVNLSSVREPCWKWTGHIMAAELFRRR